VREPKARPGAQQSADEAELQDQMVTGEDEDTSWFYSSEWQAGEREADEQLRAGQTKTYESVEDLLADLRRKSAE
jgi:hypothetical protein